MLSDRMVRACGSAHSAQLHAPSAKHTSHSSQHTAHSAQRPAPSVRPECAQSAPSAAQRGPAQPRAAKRSPAQPSAAQRSPAQPSAAQRSPVQPSAAQRPASPRAQRPRGAQSSAPTWCRARALHAPYLPLPPTTDRGGHEFGSGVGGSSVDQTARSLHEPPESEFVRQPVAKRDTRLHAFDSARARAALKQANGLHRH